MAAKRPLKVYRTSAGFADAYIAVPSQKAALAAWGADRNLFGLGMAELVTDVDLANFALASPGAIIRVPKGTTADHLAAAVAGETSRRRDGDDESGRHTTPGSPEPGRSEPRPSRQKLDDARDALERRRDQQARDLQDLDARIMVLKAPAIPPARGRQPTPLRRLPRWRVRREQSVSISSFHQDRGAVAEARQSVAAV